MTEKEKKSGTPSSEDSLLTIVQALMCHRQGEESEGFSRRAIKSLVRKLMDKREELDSLIQAVTTYGAVPSKCVTLPRSLDGRLQVAGRKGCPHVIYGKIWRWSNVHKNELKHIKECEFAYNLKCDSICVNPYHYERVYCPDISKFIRKSKVVVESGMDIDDEINQIIQHHPTPQAPAVNNPQPQQSFIPGVATSNPGIVQPLMNSLDVGNQQQPLNTTSGNTSEQILNSIQGQSTEPFYGTALPLQDLNQPPATDDPLAEILSIVQPLMNSLDVGNQQQPLNTTSGNTSEQILNSTHGQSTEPFYGTALPPQDLNQLPASIDTLGATLSFQMLTDGSQDSCMQPAPDHQHLHTASASYWDTHGSEVRGNLLSSQPAPEYWCSVGYFELDSQVGEPFKVSSSFPIVTVDGYVDPSGGNRFCLGALTNVHRTYRSEKVRLYIGKGVVLELQGEGDVWLKCESQNSVFVQSYYLDREAGRAPGDAVHKIYPTAYIKVFDLRQCLEQMKEKVASAQAATAVVAGHFTHGAPVTESVSAAAGIGVDDLRRLCILRLSFVKGWGPDYPRKSIKETPCWIEVSIIVRRIYHPDTRAPSSSTSAPRRSAADVSNRRPVRY